MMERTPDRLAASAEGVDIWVLGTPALQTESSADLQACLSASERDRMQRFITPELRQHYLLSRVLVRRVLARYAGVSAEHWQFVLDGHGRPHVAPAQMPAQGLYFSLSHTEGCMLLAVSSNPVIGVDVEDTRRAVDVWAIARRFFSPIDVAQLEQVTAQQLLTRFWKLWVLKEAYAKARSLGLALGFEGFGFSCVAGTLMLVEYSPTGVRVRDDWQVHRFKPSAFHVAALCAASGPVQPRFFELSDLTTMAFVQAAYQGSRP